MKKSAKPTNIVGKRVAKARNQSDPPLTQDDLSGKVAKLGFVLDRSAIAKIETDRRHVLDFELKALADALNVSVPFLLGIES